MTVCTQDRHFFHLYSWKTLSLHGLNLSPTLGKESFICITTSPIQEFPKQTNGLLPKLPAIPSRVEPLPESQDLCLSTETIKNTSLDKDILVLSL